MEANENKRRLSEFHCFVLKFRLFKRVFDQLNLLKYCGFKVNESKEKPSRFIRYNQCKLMKLTFLYPLLRTVYLNLQNVAFLLKVYVFYAV